MCLRVIFAFALSIICLSCRPADSERTFRASKQHIVKTESKVVPVQQLPVKVVYPNVPGSFVVTAKKLKPSVINIFTSKVIHQGPFFNWNIYGDILGGPVRDRIQRSLGSGFILDPQGYLLTNYHVVKGADEILVQMEDGRKISAMVTGVEPGIDVALLHIEANDLNPVELGDSDALNVGEWVIAVGNPFGLSHTVTSGIVSAKGRGLRDLGMSKGGYHNFIQTDASINPGNSGGPLANMAGQVVGINTAISAEGQGIGFAVPINMVKVILKQLKNRGRVVPTWIGIGIRELEKSEKQILNIEKGVLVTQVYLHGPADMAGMLPGDIILKLNSHAIDKADELGWLTSTMGIGNNAKVNILRRGKTLDFEVKVSIRPDVRGR